MKFTTALRSGVILALLSVGEASGAWAQAATAMSLHDRIEQAYDADTLSDPKADLARLQPVMDAALADPDLDVDDLARISLVYALAVYDNGNAQEAKSVIERALNTVTKKNGDTDQYLPDLLKNYAVYQSHSGDPEGGLETQKRALALAIKQYGPDASEVGSIYGHIAFTNQLLGRLQDALTNYQLCLQRLKPEDAPTAYVGDVSTYANDLRLHGDYEDAIVWSTKAIEAAKTYLPPENKGVGYAYNSLGDSLFAVGRYAEAEALYRQAQGHAVQYRGKTSFEAGLYTLSIARALYAQGDDGGALPLMQSALDILKVSGSSSVPDIVGSALSELANVAYDRGDVEQAIAYDHQALDALAPLGTRGINTRARVETQLAQALLVSGRPQDALPYVDDALIQFRAQYEPYAINRANAEMLRALILARLGRNSEAYDIAQSQAEIMVLKINDARTSRTEQIDLSSSYQINFSRYADIAYASGHQEVAFEAAQLAGLSEVANPSQALAARAAAANPQAADVLRQLQDAQARRQHLERERNFARGKSDNEVTVLTDEMTSLDQHIADLTASLAKVYPQYDAISHPKPAGMQSVRRGLKGDEAVLMPVLVDDRALVLTLTRSGLVGDISSLDKTHAGLAVRAIRRATAAEFAPGSAFDRTPLWTLGHGIFTPSTMAALEGKTQIDLMGSGSLMTVPFAILLTEAPHGDDSDPDALRNSAWAVRRFSFTVKPSLAIYEGHQSQAKGFLGIGAPILGPEKAGYAGFNLAPYRGTDANMTADVKTLRQLPSLPNAEDELRAMQSAFGRQDSTLLVGADATETRVKSTDLSRFGVIAFATHGLISGNLISLREPALVMTPPDTPNAEDDGLLTASEVAGLHLNARWVILSACNTGSGREAGAGGYSGLANAFMQAGARGLLVSLWTVRDDMADRLSVDTVRNTAAGMPQAEALRQATLKVLNDKTVPGGSNPVVWGPFSLVAQ